MEGGGFFPFGGDPEELLKGLREFAEQQADGVKDAQREQFATLTLGTGSGVDEGRARSGHGSARSTSRRSHLRDAMRVLFPEAVALVSAARQGFMA